MTGRCRAEPAWALRPATLWAQPPSTTTRASNVCLQPALQMQLCVSHRNMVEKNTVRAEPRAPTPAMLPSATLSEGLPRECADCPGTVTSRCRPRRERRWASPLVFPRRRRWAFIDFDASLLRNTWKPLSGKSVASREAQDGHQPRQVGGGLRGGLAPGACDAASAPSHRAAPESWARGLWGGRSGSGTAFSSDPCARDSRSGRLGSRGCKMGARRRPS